jgi:acyl-CoA synthetase (AMP-forming)/AMP-acid ligase II
MTTTVPALTLLSRMHDHARRQPSAPAYTFLGDDGQAQHVLSYADLDVQVRATAAALRERLKPGDRALLLLPEGRDFVPAFLGCLEAGVIAVPAYPPLPVQSRQRVETLRAIVRNCQPSAVLTAAPPEVVAEVRAVTPELADVWWARAGDLASTPAPDGPLWSAEPSDIAFLQYTSGSTSAPKGVVVTHEALVHNEELIRECMGHSENLRMVTWLPLFHDMGLIGNVLQPLWTGGDAVLIAPMAFIKRPVRWLRAISDFRGTTNGGPNFAYDLCAERIKDEELAGLDLSSWQVAFNGAEPVRAQTLRTFAERFAPYGFDANAWYPCYGMAETTLIVTGVDIPTAPPEIVVDRDALRKGLVEETEDGQRLVASGHPRLDRTVLIVDPQTRTPLAEDQVGEIWVGGPSLPIGYWGDPDASERTFNARPVTRPDQPHLRTGDLGFVHEGELYVTGRLKDVLIVGGRNHYPQDIELSVERAHAAIRRGCVAAFSYERDDAEHVVVVVGVGQGATGASEAAAAKRAEIIRSVRAAVSTEHGLPLHDVAVVGPNAVPKTSSGKLRRGACRDAYLDGDYTVGRDQ